MNAGARIAAFVALLSAIFAGAALAGAAIDPEGDVGEQRAASGHGTAGDHGSEPERRGSAGAGGMPAGVVSAQDGLRLVAETTRFAAGRPATFTFRILDADSNTVRDFELEQARRMHLIVVRRDLRRYQHLHPTQRPDGAWTTRLTLPDAGVYRAFADFTSDGARRTLGIDIFVAGAFMPRDLPAAATTARVDGYEVKLHEQGDDLDFSVRRGGKLVANLQPYLGARGHLVALREGDLAYEHVHPRAKPPPAIAFHVAASEPGSYRLFLQFRHEGRVHTAAFTRVVKP